VTEATKRACKIEAKERGYPLGSRRRLCSVRHPGRFSQSAGQTVIQFTTKIRSPFPTFGMRIPLPYPIFYRIFIYGQCIVETLICLVDSLCHTFDRSASCKHFADKNVEPGCRPVAMMPIFTEHLPLVFVIWLLTGHDSFCLDTILC